MKKAVLRSSIFVVGTVLTLTVAPGLRRAAGNPTPQGQARATDTVGARENLAVPLVAPTQRYSSG